MGELNKDTTEKYFRKVHHYEIVLGNDHRWGKLLSIYFGLK